MCVCTSVPEAQQTMTALPEHQEPLHSSQDSRGSTQQQWTPHGSHENLAEEACMYVVKHTKTYIHMYCMHVQCHVCCIHTYICTVCMYNVMLYVYIHTYVLYACTMSCMLYTYIRTYVLYACTNVMHAVCMYMYKTVIKSVT